MRFLVLAIVACLALQCALGHPARKHNMTKATEEKLKKSIPGGNLEVRLAKLNRLAGLKTKKIVTKKEKQPEPLNDTQIVDPNGDDQVAVNENLGISEYFYEGDINFSEKQLDALIEEAESGNTTRSKRQMKLDEFMSWPEGKVYYELDTTLSDRKKTIIATAMAYIQARTCLTFINDPTAADRLLIFNGDGCWSYIGMQGGVQEVSIGNGCEVIGTVAHELTHALGSYHEQSRYDRDNAVTVDLTYVDPKYQGNFDKTTSGYTINHTPYEYGSMMQYSATSFTQAGKISMFSKDANYQFTMGGRLISYYDILMINTQYKCLAKCPAATSARCYNAGYPNPRKCSVCICPTGLGGLYCQTRTGNNGITVNATAAWQEYTTRIGTADAAARDDFVTRIDWIVAPAGKKIQFGVVASANPQCRYGCGYNGIEFKISTDIKATGMRICCGEQMNKIITSGRNPTIIQHYNRHQYSSFTVKYRFV